MKANIIYLYIIFFSCSCTLFETQKCIKQYNFYEGLNSSKLVALKVNEFQNFEILIKRLQTIYCNDSIPLIIIKNKLNQEKQIIPSIFCFEKEECGLYIVKNHISIEDDIIHKGYNEFPLDSLSYLMRKDYTNFGKESSYSSHPDKVVIEISYSQKTMKNLSSILEQITSIYDDLKVTSPLRISIKELVIVPPPPSSTP